jgi:hypothetical protein
MTFDEFIRLKRNVLLGHYLMNQWHPNKFAIEVPYPPFEISEDDLEALKDKLDEFMPLESTIVDLWAWDARFEKELGDEWYFGAIFGDESSIEACAADLADYFHEQVEYFGKLYVIDPIFSIDYSWLGTTFLSHHFLTVKRFLIEPSFPG